jgi:hypothetical protein
MGIHHFVGSCATWLADQHWVLSEIIYFCFGFNTPKLASLR